MTRKVGMNRKTRAHLPGENLIPQLLGLANFILMASPNHLQVASVHAWCD
jgi:hypothetical protein